MIAPRDDVDDGEYSYGIGRIIDFGLGLTRLE